MIRKERNNDMSEKKEIMKEIADAELEKTAGGAVSGRVHYNYKCSCGNVVMRGIEEPPTFPCPKCMKREWTFAGANTVTLPPHMMENKG